MVFGRCLLILTIFLLIATSLSANDNDPYALPPTKAFVETCNREALILHPGAIDKERILHRHGNNWVEYEIQASDGSEWLVVCDLSTGKVSREQKLVDGTF